MVNAMSHDGHGQSLLKGRIWPAAGIRPSAANSSSRWKAASVSG